MPETILCLASYFKGGLFLEESKRLGVRTILLAGYHLDWCVEMAARTARELGLVPIVVGDATGTTHPLHEQTLAQINDAYAPVIDTAFALEAIAAADAG